MSSLISSSDSNSSHGVMCCLFGGLYIVSSLILSSGSKSSHVVMHFLFGGLYIVSSLIPSSGSNSCHGVMCCLFPGSGSWLLTSALIFTHNSQESTSPGYTCRGSFFPLSPGKGASFVHVTY